MNKKKFVDFDEELEFGSLAPTSATTQKPTEDNRKGSKDSESTSSDEFKEVKKLEKEKKKQ